MNNDIALLKLSRKVKFTKYIRPACVPSAAAVIRTGANAFVSGWGATSEGGSTSPILKVARVCVAFFYFLWNHWNLALCVTFTHAKIWLSLCPFAGDYEARFPVFLCSLIDLELVQITRRALYSWAKGHTTITIFCTGKGCINCKFAVFEILNIHLACTQGWKKYRTTGPLVPENILAPRKKKITPKNVQCNMLTF